MNSVTENRSTERADAVRQLRRFHYGEPAAAAKTEVPPADVLPALLDPYRDAAAVRYEYPLYLVPADAPSDAVLAKPLSDHLLESIDAFAPGDAARILRDNLPWLERRLRQALAGPDPADAPALFDEAASALLEHLELNDANREQLESDLAALRKAFATGSRLLAYGEFAALHLLVHAVRHGDRRRRRRLEGRIEKARRGLEALLDVETAKAAPPGIDDRASQHLDAGRLKSVLETRARGSKALPPDRIARIETSLDELRSWSGERALARFVGPVGNPWFDDQDDLDVVDSEEPCADADKVFLRDAERFARLFAALRTAALEIDDDYSPAVHDSWFAGFDWQSFSEDELGCVTRTVAIAPADHLAGDGLPSFSRLLGSRLPVHVVSWVRAYDNPSVRPGEGPFDGYRFELAYFGLGHRHVVVAQISAARHTELLAGFACALAGNRTSLHLVNRGTQTTSKQPVLDPWFVASAALESRAHPFLLIDPPAGDRAAERVTFDGNPQTDKDWPVETFAHEGLDGGSDTTLAFTFADYALLIPALHEHFRVVPAGCTSDDLVSIGEYLERSDEAVERLVPYVLGITAEGELARLAVSRALVFACRDRLNYWHALQELAGVHNFYVERAIERVLDDAQAAAGAERDALMKTHAKELDDARSAAAGEAMGQLVDVLMGTDLSAMVDSVAPVPATAEPENAGGPFGPGRPDVAEHTDVRERPGPNDAAADAASAEEALVEEEEDPGFDDPWLDTAACTTCDDCMSINKMMFVYNEDKQAILKDPRAGTYADLVKAAEICPARCIHPGKPLDPDEPGLEELIARAEPFN